MSENYKVGDFFYKRNSMDLYKIVGEATKKEIGKKQVNYWLVARYNINKDSYHGVDFEIDKTDTFERYGLHESKVDALQGTIDSLKKELNFRTLQLENLKGD